jgi:SpoVK/Ycf46/Vps4 family AAA+-type ATPase
MGLWRAISSLHEQIDFKIEEKIKKIFMNQLIVHSIELPAYRFVDLFNAIECFVGKHADVKKIETMQSETLNDLLHSKAGRWIDRSIKKSNRISWPTGPKSQRFLPTDCFWICPSKNLNECYIVRLTFDQMIQKTRIELACGNSSLGEGAVDEITKYSVDNSIYRNSIIHLVHETEKKDEYGDIEKAESLQVVFSPVETVAEKDIILSSEHVELLQRNVIDLQVRRKILKANGVPTRRGILFHGPPGTGKTFACRYICHQLKETTCILATGSALANVGAIFSLGRLLQPSILFIEDADLMFAARDNNLYSTSLGDLMDQMDGLRAQEDVSVIMTTNDIDRLEVALKDRPGRISQCIYMGAPNSDLRLRDLSPIFPPVLWRIHNFIYGLMRPVFAMPFSWRIRWA